MNKTDLLIDLTKMLNESLEAEKTAKADRFIDWQQRQQGFTNAIIEIIDLVNTKKE